MFVNEAIGVTIAIFFEIMSLSIMSLSYYHCKLFVSLQYCSTVDSA